MTPQEAIEVALDAIGCLDFCDPNETRDIRKHTDEAAAILSKLGPFIEAAMEWGANSVEWDNVSWDLKKGPNSPPALRLAADKICLNMDKAYRALVAPTQEPSEGSGSPAFPRFTPEEREALKFAIQTIEYHHPGDGDAKIIKAMIAGEPEEAT